MATYYIAGFSVSDELYHHGITGQKWGIRRYQNEDGTLTTAGKQRYGKGLGQYATKKEGVVRKLATGNWFLGRKQLAERYEDHTYRKIKTLEQQGQHAKAKAMEKTYKAQRQRNIDREKYLSNTSTGKIIAQNILLGISADSYRVERQNQESRGKAATAAILGNIGDCLLPGTGFIIGESIDMHKSEKRYGRIAF